MYLVNTTIQIQISHYTQSFQLPNNQIWKKHAISTSWPQGLGSKTSGISGTCVCGTWFASPRPQMLVDTTGMPRSCASVTIKQKLLDKRKELTQPRLMIRWVMIRADHFSSWWGRCRSYYRYHLMDLQGWSVIHLLRWNGQIIRLKNEERGLGASMPCEKIEKTRKSIALPLKQPSRTMNRVLIESRLSNMIRTILCYHDI